MCCSNNKDHQLWLGLVAFVIGAVLLLQRFDLVPAETWDYLWPSILVVTGLKWMISRNSDSCQMEDSCMCGGNSCDGSCELPMPAPKKATSKKKSRK
ncbi:MAG: DUF5668 domain-containing protein [Patescibacteria group bacterium]